MFGPSLLSWTKGWENAEQSKEVIYLSIIVHNASRSTLCVPDCMKKKLQRLLSRSSGRFSLVIIKVELNLRMICDYQKISLRVTERGCLNPNIILIISSYPPRRINIIQPDDQTWIQPTELTILDWLCEQSWWLWLNPMSLSSDQVRYSVFRSVLFNLRSSKLGG